MELDLTKQIKIGSVVLDYCFDEYNSAYNNERKIEVALGKYFIDKYNNDVIEAGTVMRHYNRNFHKMLDLTEIGNGIINCNALEYDYSNSNCLSISTLEHMIKREYNNGTDYDSIICLNKIIKESKNYLITVPQNYNEFLDAALYKSGLQRISLKRDKDNIWSIESDVDNFNYRFGHRDNRAPDGVWNNSNAFFLITNQSEFYS